MTTAGATSEYSVPTAASGLGGIVAGPDGALWFTEYFPSQIGRITDAGVITESPALKNGFPRGIAAGPDGALWFANYTNQIARITTAGVVTATGLPPPIANPRE